MIDLDTERPQVAVTTEGQPSTVEANGNASLAHHSAAGKPDSLAIPPNAFERLVQSAIDLLDCMNGDFDLEPDELDAEHDGREPEGGL